MNIMFVAKMAASAKTMQITLHVILFWRNGW